MSASDCYVYIWFYPTGVPLYVGWGRWRLARKRQRYEDHLRGSRNRQLAAAFRKHGTDLPLVIVRDDLASHAKLVAIGRDLAAMGGL